VSQVLLLLLPLLPGALLGAEAGVALVHIQLGTSAANCNLARLNGVD
jgi:hypothetical protein